MPTLTSSQGTLTGFCTPNDTLQISVSSGVYSLEYPPGTALATASSTNTTYTLGAGSYRLQTTGSITYTLNVNPDAGNADVTYDTSTGGFYANGGLVLGAGNQQIVAVGDSLTERYELVSGANLVGQSTSFLQWALAFLGQRLVGFARGVSGATTTQVLARWAADVSSFRPAWIHLLAGGNDISADVPASTIITNLTSMISLARSQGARVIVGTLYPFTTHNTAARRQTLYQVNAWIRSLASDSVRVVDYHAAMVDAAGAVRSGMLVADNIHPSARGASIMGRVLAAVLADLPPRLQALASSAYDADQGVPCGELAGNHASGASNFTAGTGMTGTGPRGWTWSRTGAALAATVSKQARSGNSYATDFARGAITTSGADYDVLRFERLVAYRLWSSGGTANSVRRFYVPSTGAQYDVLVDGAFAAGADPTAGWPTTPGAVFTDGTATLICITPLVSGSTVRLMAECNISSVSVGQVHPAINASFLNTAGSTLGTVHGMYHDSGNAVMELAEEASAGLVIGSPLYTVPAGFDLESTTTAAGPILRVRLEVSVIGSALATVDWGRVTMRRV